MLGIYEVVIGGLGVLFGIAYGIYRLVKNPKGYNFSEKDATRWSVFMAACLVLGAALLVFGIINLVCN